MIFNMNQSIRSEKQARGDLTGTVVRLASADGGHRVNLRKGGRPEGQQ